MFLNVPDTYSTDNSNFNMKNNRNIDIMNKDENYKHFQILKYPTHFISSVRTPR